MTADVPVDQNPYNSKDRRRQIERAFKEWPFRSSGRGVGSVPGVLTSRLRETLEVSGPIFSLFGLYLASRPDWIPLQDCLELGAIQDRSPAMTGTSVRARFLQELGRPPEQLFLSFDETPDQSRLTFQTHKARLVDGTPVNINIARPFDADEMEGETRLLSLLEPVFAAESWTDLPFEEAISDFQRILPRMLTEPVSFESLDLLAEDEKQFHHLAVPRAYRDYSGRTVRTCERLSGWTLAEIIQANDFNDLDQISQGRTPLDLLGLTPGDIARRICQVWLQQAFYGSVYPIALHPTEIVMLTTHQIAFTGGQFATLPTSTKENVRNYLLACAIPDPDRAYACLTQEMEEADRAQAEQGLRNRFRQIVPFRDGPWSQTGSGDTLAEHLFVHWRLSREFGYHVRIHMRDFYRGLFAVTRQTQQLVLGRDTLKEGLNDLRYTVGMSEMRDMMDVRVWQDTANAYAMSLIHLPHLLNEAISKTPTEDPRPPKTGEDSGRGIGVSSGLIGLFSLLVVTVFVSRHLTQALGENEWVQNVSTGTLIVIGLLALRLIYRK